MEIKEPGDFPMGLEVVGAESLVPSVGHILLQSANPLCPAVLSDTGFKKDRKQLL